MPAVQTTYGETMRVGVPGMIVNSETQNVITKTNNSATAIPFGQPVMRSGDHTCVFASANVITASGANGVPAPAGATISAVVVGAGAKAGVYHATCIVAGATTTSKWEVEDPDGVMVGIATGNTAFTGGGLTFTITDSGTDPAVGERFDITAVVSDDLDVLGLSVRDTSLDVSNSDTFKRYDSVPVLTMGVMWVTAGGTVVASNEVYWDPATSKFVADTTKTRIPGWKFDSGGGTDALVRVARR